MKYQIVAKNKNNGKVIEYEIEGNPTDGYTYKGVPIADVADNVIREINNNLLLPFSPINTVTAGHTVEQDTSMTFDIKITAE